MIHTAVLLLGSNVRQREAMLLQALRGIDTLGTRRSVSDVCLSDDISGLGSEYANITAVYTTEMPLNDFCTALSALECEAGRTPSSKYTGVMPLDIDVVMWDGRLVSPDDYARPYFCRQLSEWEG